MGLFARSKTSVRLLHLENKWREESASIASMRDVGRSYYYSRDNAISRHIYHFGGGVWGSTSRQSGRAPGVD